MKKIALILPCFDEADVLPVTIDRLRQLLLSLAGEETISPESFLLFVDDGSDDATWQIIRDNSGARLRGIRLNRRCGHQTALLAGIEEALPLCDACITIDADLQDDISVIPDMIKAYEEGADVVCGVRRDRSSDSWIKKTSADAFYSTMRNLGADSVPHHADFRLMSRRAMTDLLAYEERNLYLRGLVPLLGYRQEKVYYDRAPRTAGKSKYPMRKMIDFAVDGITSFSVVPVRMIFRLGILFTVTAFGIGIYSLFRYFNGETIAGWTSLILSIWFCTGVLLMALGVIGVYIGKIYIEVKKRPRYRVADRI